MAKYVQIWQFFTNQWPKHDLFMVYLKIQNLHNDYSLWQFISIYRKIPNISPGLIFGFAPFFKKIGSQIIFQRLFLRNLNTLFSNTVFTQLSAYSGGGA